MARVMDRGQTSAARAETGTVFILGPARSGTTLLYKGLCLHPEIAFISNWSARFPGLSAVAALNRVPRRLPTGARQIWFGRGSNAYVYGTPRRLIDRMFPTPVEGEPVYTQAGVDRPGGPPPAPVDPRTALPAAFDSIRSLGSGRAFVSKRIANNLRIRCSTRCSRRRGSSCWSETAARSPTHSPAWTGGGAAWSGGTGERPERWRAEGKDPGRCAPGTGWRSWPRSTRDSGSFPRSR